MKRTPLKRVTPLARAAQVASAARRGRMPLKRGRGLKPRSDKTARRYVTRRAIVAELFAEPVVCEVPWCTDTATDPHEPLTRARGGDILDRDNIRLVCHFHNRLFASAEEPWMYQLGFLRHSWDKGEVSERVVPG